MNALVDNMLSYNNATAPDPVKQVQQLLLDAGFDPGGIDGIAGPKTGKAVAAYQKSKGLPVTGTITHDTMQALIGEPTVMPKPTPRPAAPGPDVLGTALGAENFRYSPRPPPEVLGSGNTNVEPRLREDIPVTVAENPLAVNMLSGPPPGANGQFGRSGPQGGSRPNSLVTAAQNNARINTGNPDARIAPDTTWDQMQRLGMASGARTTEAMQRAVTDSSLGGGGQQTFPQMSRTPMQTGNIPVFEAGGNAGNDLPAPTEKGSWITPQQKAARVAQLKNAFGATAPTAPTDAQIAAAKEALSPQLRKIERGGDPGIGLPWLEPQDDFFSALGEMGKAMAKWYTGIAQAKP